MTIKIAIAAVEYVILFCICAFVYKTMRAMYKQLHEKAYSEATVQSGRKAALTVLRSYDENLVNKRISFSSLISIGRGPDNNIILTDAYVSHHHATVAPIKNQYQLEDLRSRNHTYVNNKEVHGKIFLRNEDVIKIGTTVFKFER